jgi:hypothetical protein
VADVCAVAHAIILPSVWQMKSFWTWFESNIRNINHE